MKIITLILLLVSFVAGASKLDSSANALVKKADEIRNPSDSYEMNIEVETEDGTSIFQVYLKGKDKTLILTKAPARDKGRNMLMLDRDFHAYVPNLKRSMRLSLMQKLSGQVSNGDIARTRWHGDYEAKIEKKSAKEIQLLLKAQKKNLTYSWIRLWVENKTSRPLRADYLGTNGKTLLKKAFFEDYKNIAGAYRPTSIRILDPGNKKSYIRVKSMESQKFEDSFFTIRNMESMK